uniref:Reverse transcriptase domain-containing protein n=1 Tax=Tanacetum cinerariifolium TaxID=118510 RepID=A0A6L2N604_TANCI|nr:reverse transcriptase domain-containing protein [Tanacetum cinerariifolium]
MMVDQRSMAELLRAPTKGYTEAIVVPPILVEQFELKHSLINMMTSDQFFGVEKDNPHDHIRCVSPPVATLSRNFWVRGKLDPAKRRWEKDQDNIQGYVAAAAVNYNQGNSGYRSLVWLIKFDHRVLINRMCKITKTGLANLKDIIEETISIKINLIKLQLNKIKPLPSNTIANPKGELKAITTQSGIVLDGPFVHMPHPFINPEEDEREEETLTDQDLAEYTIKVLPPLVQKPNPPSQRNFVVHQRDPLHPNIPYPSRMLKKKKQEKDEVQIHKFWKMFKQLHINITLADALILILKYKKMLKALLLNKEKLLERTYTPLNENCSVVILKKLPEKLRDPGKFCISCGFSELKCKALADLGASINLMPLYVWKKLGLTELISTRMTLELANRAICTPAEIARDVFALVGKFTFPTDFVIVDYESDPKVSLILGKPFLWTARALIDVHGEEMILRDEGCNVLIEKLSDLDSTKDLHPFHIVNPLSSSTTSSSPNHLLEEFADEFPLITFPPGNDDLPFDIESDLKEIEDLHNHDPIKDIDSVLKDLIDQTNLVDFNDNLVDTMPKMFTDEHALDYSSPPLYDEYDDDLFEFESDTKNVYDDPFDSKGEKIKESKLLIDELDLLSDFLPSSEYDSFLFEDFSKATNFQLKNDMIQQVQNFCQFHGLPGDDANKHLDKFLHVTQSIKVNGVTDDALRLYLFPHSLTYHAIAWFDRLPRNSINTFEQMAKMFLEKYFPPSMVTKLRNEITNFRQRPDESLFEAWERGTFMKRRPEEYYDHIENMTAHHNDWDTSAQRSESSSSIATSSDTKIAALKAKMAEINKNLMRVLKVNQQVKAVTPNCETCGGPHSFSDFPATVGNTQNVYAAGAYQGNSYQPQGNRNLLSYRSNIYLGQPGFNQNQNHNNQNQNRNQGNHHPQRNNHGRNQFFQGASQNQPPAYQAPAYQAPVYQAPVHQPQIPQPHVVTTNEFTNFMKANDAILKNMQTNMTSLTNSNLELKNMFGQFMKMNTASSSGSGTLPGNTITNLKEDLKGITTRRGTAYLGPTIPITSSSPVVKRETEATRDKFGLSIKSLLTKKDKLFELARTLLNEHCSVVLPKKLLEELRDPGKFLISCDFPGMADCLALADLGASINLMPLSVWNKFSLPDLYPTCMTLELTDRLISHPVGVAEDVFVKVGTFHFPTDFVVVDFDADHRVPLIVGRSFLKTGRALIDVFKGELTLRIGKEAITFNLDQTSRYSANYNDMMANRIDVIDMPCEEYSQEVLSFSDVIASGNPTPYYDPIVSTTSSTLTPFKNSDFLLE